MAVVGLRLFHDFFQPKMLRHKIIGYYLCIELILLVQEEIFISYCVSRATHKEASSLRNVPAG